MFEDLGKSNLLTVLALGLASALLPKLLPELRPAVGTAAKVVFDLLTESEAEASEELIETLVSSTIAAIRDQMARPGDPDQSRQAVERTVARFKRRARRRASSWAADAHDRKRRYHRHLNKLREAVERTKIEEAGWQRNILDDLGESIEEEAV